MTKHTTNIKLKSPLVLLVLWGLLLEFPVRYLLSPDPWIHSSDHWYFDQPSRVLLELGFVLLAVIPFFFVKELKKLLSVQWTRQHRLFFAVGIAGSVLIFGLQQLEDIQLIQQASLFHYVPLWFITGIIVGFGQELTFRGLIYTGLSEKYGVKPAVILSTLCFALGSIHSARLYHYLMNDYVFETLLLLVIFVLAGLFFVWVRIKTDNILIPAIIHGAGNAITWATFVVVKLHA